MELTDALKARRSIRKFKPDPIPDNLVTELLEAARLAPSGTNLQPWRFVILKSEEARARLADCTPLPFVYKAPLVIVCCADTQALETMKVRINELKESGAFMNTPLEKTGDDSYVKSRRMDAETAKAYTRLNTAIAIEHITLRAVDLGLGTCWVMMFSQEKVKEALDLEDKYNVVALLPLGYPDQLPAPRPRLPLEDLVLKEL